MITEFYQRIFMSKIVVKYVLYKQKPQTQGFSGGNTA